MYLIVADSLLIVAIVAIVANSLLIVANHCPGPTRLREFVETTVILPPGVGNPGSVLAAVAHFRWIRWIRWIRWRIPGSPKIEYSTATLAHLLGKCRQILGSTLENIRKSKVSGFSHQKT